MGRTSPIIPISARWAPQGLRRSRAHDFDLWPDAVAGGRQAKRDVGARPVEAPGSRLQPEERFGANPDGPSRGTLSADLERADPTRDRNGIRWYRCRLRAEHPLSLPRSAVFSHSPEPWRNRFLRVGARRPPRARQAQCDLLVSLGAASSVSAAAHLLPFMTQSTSGRPPDVSEIGIVSALNGDSHPREVVSC
jgi:hypothetical protein